jgi:hypothetical protein
VLLVVGLVIILSAGFGQRWLNGSSLAEACLLSSVCFFSEDVFATQKPIATFENCTAIINVRRSRTSRRGVTALNAGLLT